MKKSKKKRHQLARMTVDVYRLFKIRDAASALKSSTDGIVRQLADQMWNETTIMLKPYIDEQNRLAVEPHKNEFMKALKSLKKSKPKPSRRIRLG